MSDADLKLDQLESMASELRRKRSELFEHVNRWRDERDGINEASRKIRDEALKHKEERDRLNARVAEVKVKLQPLYEQLDEKRKKLQTIEAAVDAEYRELPKKRRVERDLNYIEWEVMTTPTRDMLDREEELVRRADDLRKRLTSFKKPPKKTEATMEATAETKATEMEIRHIRDEIGIIREQSQVHHEAMLMLHRKADEERIRANNAHAKFVEYINEVKKVDAESDSIILQIRGIRDGVRQEELKVERAKMAKVNAKVEELKQEALRKMAAGEKLTFDDLQFIYGSEEDDDEDTQTTDKLDPKPEIKQGD